MKNNPERTSLRSATQATDSARSGCTAKTRATRAEGQLLRVRASSARKSRAAVSACSTTLVRWCGPGSMPKSWTSSMWESHVKGCQLDAWTLVKAHEIPSRLRPRATTGLRVT